MRRVMFTVIALTVTVGLGAQSKPDVTVHEGGRATAEPAQAPSAPASNLTDPADASTTQPATFTSDLTTATSGRKVTHAGDMDANEQRALLKRLQDTHHSLQQALDDVAKRYATECTSLHRQVAEPCVTLHMGMSVELPHLIRRVQDSINALAMELGEDPTEAPR